MKNKPFQTVILLVVLLMAFANQNAPAMHAASLADTSNYSAIDEFVNEQMKALKIPGVALAIVQDGQIQYLQGYGIADATRRAVTPQTPFMLASVSKSFTSLAIMQLVEHKKLDLDTPVQKYLSWFQLPDKQASGEITVRQLLNQTSGFSQLDGNRINLSKGTAKDSLATDLEQVKHFNLVNPPGASFTYSNVNYGLLGAIIETASEQPYEEYVQQHIFDPLEMQHTYTSLSEAQKNGGTEGFYPLFGMLIQYNNYMPYSRTVTPWAGVFSSAEDLSHYMIAQLNEGKYGDTNLLSPTGINELHKPGIQIDKWTGYAMGWWVRPDFDIASHNQASYTAPIAIYHEGSWANFRSLVALIPQKNIGVAVLMNTNDPAIDSTYAMVGWNVLAIYSGYKPSSYPPSEDFVRQHARLLFTGIILILLASLIWFSRKLRYLKQQANGIASRRLLLGYVLFPLLIDAFIAWYILARELPQSNTTVWLTLRLAPDLGLLTVLVLTFTIGWGVLRTLLVLRAIFLKPRRNM